MKIILKKLDIENFKSFKKKIISFKETTTIYGMNESGKSTVFDAFSWLLRNKDSNGNAKFDIRTNDKEGNPIHNTEIKVTACFDADGKEIVLEKVQKENWVKKRGTDIVEFQGNKNEFSVNLIPKSEKDFNEYVSNLFDETVFELITNPKTFVTMDWKKQREMLLKIATTDSDYDISVKKEKFNSLSRLLSDYTIEELTAKSKKALSEYKKTMVEIPARIDEATKQLSTADVEELKARKSYLESELLELEELEKDSSKELDRYNKLSNNLMQLNFHLSDLKRESNAENSKIRAGLTSSLDNCKSKIDSLTKEVEKLNSEIESKNTRIKVLKNDIEVSRTNWIKENEQEFDDSAYKVSEDMLECPTCGAPFSEEKRTSIVSGMESKRSEALERFNIRKKNMLDSITATGNSAKKEIDSLTLLVENLTMQIASVEEDRESCCYDLEEIKTNLEKLPEFVDISENKEYLETESKIKSLESELEKYSSANQNSTKERIAAERRTINTQINEIVSEISKADNTKIKERISELEAEQKQTGQLVANEEKMLDLLEQFTMHKMKLLAKNVNNKFKVVNFKLFKEQINGGVAECCECMVKGNTYSNLNAAHKVIAGLDIISTLSEEYNTFAPIFIDNAEGINGFNIPEMKSQMVLLSVSDDKELRVE